MGKLQLALSLQASERAPPRLGGCKGLLPLVLHREIAKSSVQEASFSSIPSMAHRSMGLPERGFHGIVVDHAVVSAGYRADPPAGYVESMIVRSLHLINH